MLSGRGGEQNERPAILAGPVKRYARRRSSTARAPLRVTFGSVTLLALAVAALLGLGRLGVSIAPVTVQLESDGAIVRVTVDGTSRTFALTYPIAVVRPVAAIAHRREHLIDGSDSTNVLTFDPTYFRRFADSPYYQFQSWLREAWRYSTWVNLEVADGTGAVVLRDAHPRDEVDVALPPQFRLTVDLERPEIPRSLELLDERGNTLVIELNRNDKYVRIGPRRAADPSDLSSWYFPREVLPPLATLLDLLTRVLALSCGLLLVVGAVGILVPGWRSWHPGPRTVAVGLALGVTAFLLASWYVAIALFDRAPHILDALAYTFQAKMLAAGLLTLPPPLVNDAFPMPFSTLYQERWFVQYPPGTAATLALGYRLGIPWLVQPLMAAGAVVLIVLTAQRQYGSGTAALVLLLLVSSPFLLLNAGAFLSHVPALFFVSVALYAVTRYADRPSAGWAALCALGLGLAFLTREVASVLFAVTVVLAGLGRGMAQRGRHAIVDVLTMLAIGGTFLQLYLAYNMALTGEPHLLPRLLVDGRDRYGFGTGVGFYNEHTIASGLVLTEQQLVSLGFYLAGWPYGFSLAVVLLPFLTGRSRPWDASYGLLLAVYVVSYAAYYYHGIVFGPRYYFEALPALAILTARGFIALAASVADWLTRVGLRGAPVRAWQATAVLVVALFACNALYFLPRQATLYADFTGLPGGGPVLDDTIGHDLSGRVARLDNALVVTDEWWFYVMYYAALNCPTFDCPAVFALGADPETREVLRRMYPERVWHNVLLRGSTLRIVPGIP